MEELRSDWKNSSTSYKTTGEIKAIIMGNNHPVLKKIRKQLVFEIIGWTVFLCCYYSMFDGHEKPFGINLILVLSVLASVVHNVSGYSFAGHLSEGSDLKTSLSNYFSKAKRFAVLSVMFRVVFSAGLLTFLCYNIHFDTFRYQMLGVILLILIAQLSYLYFLWVRRIERLKQSIGEFND